MKGMIISYLKTRLMERSTWIGIISTISGMIGYQLSPELQAAMATVVLTVIGLIGMFTPDNVKKEAPAQPEGFPSRSVQFEPRSDPGLESSNPDYVRKHDNNAARMRLDTQHAAVENRPLEMQSAVPNSGHTAGDISLDNYKRLLGD